MFDKPFFLLRIGRLILFLIYQQLSILFETFRFSTYWYAILLKTVTSQDIIGAYIYPTPPPHKGCERWCKAFMDSEISFS